MDFPKHSKNSSVLFLVGRFSCLHLALLLMLCQDGQSPKVQRSCTSPTLGDPWVWEGAFLFPWPSIFPPFFFEMKKAPCTFWWTNQLCDQRKKIQGEVSKSWPQHCFCYFQQNGYIAMKWRWSCIQSRQRIPMNMQEKDKFWGKLYALYESSFFYITHVHEGVVSSALRFGTLGRQRPSDCCIQWLI